MLKYGTSDRGWPSAIAWLLLAGVVGSTCIWVGLTAFGLVGPDEPRYAAIARDMAASGDWVTPRLFGDPWLEKPILYYWMAAAAYGLLGDTELAARMPSVLGALAITVTLVVLAVRVYGTLTGALLLLLLPTTVGVIGFARGATPDMVFAAALIATMAASASLVLPRPDAEDLSRRKVRLRQVAFGAALGLAVLAKGPVGVVLAGGSLGLWGVASGRWRSLGAVVSPWAVASSISVALPWYVLCAIRNPEFVQVFLISHNVERFLTPSFGHEQPFWFFGPILAVGVAPWSALLVVMAGDALAAARDWSRSARSPAVFFACWAVAPLVFFSVSSSKLPGYILPVIPVVTLLMARSLAQRLESAGGAPRWTIWGTGGVLAAMAAALLTPGVINVPGFEAAPLRSLGLGVAAASAIVTYLGSRRQIGAAVAATSLVMCAVLVYLTVAVLPQLDPLISPRASAHALQAFARDEVRVYRLHRAWHLGLNYYLGRPLAEWTPGEAPGSVVVTSERGAEELRDRGVVARIVERISSEAFIVRLDADPHRVARAGVR